MKTSRLLLLSLFSVMLVSQALAQVDIFGDDEDEATQVPWMPPQHSDADEATQAPPQDLDDDDFADTREDPTPAPAMLPFDWGLDDRHEPTQSPAAAPFDVDLTHPDGPTQSPAVDGDVDGDATPADLSEPTEAPTPADDGTDDGTGGFPGLGSAIETTEAPFNVPGPDPAFPASEPDSDEDATTKAPFKFPWHPVVPGGSDDEATVAPAPVSSDDDATTPDAAPAATDAPAPLPGPDPAIPISSDDEATDAPVSDTTVDPYGINGGSGTGTGGSPGFGSAIETTEAPFMVPGPDPAVPTSEPDNNEDPTTEAPFKFPWPNPAAPGGSDDEATDAPAPGSSDDDATTPDGAPGAATDAPPAATNAPIFAPVVIFGDDDSTTVDPFGKNNGSGSGAGGAPNAGSPIDTSTVDPSSFNSGAAKHKNAPPNWAFSDIDPTVLKTLGRKNQQLDRLPGELEDGTRVDDMKDGEVVINDMFKDEFPQREVNMKEGQYVLSAVQTKNHNAIYDPFTIGQVLGYLYEYNEFQGEPPAGGWTLEMFGKPMPTWLSRKRRAAKIRRATLIFKKKAEVIAKEEEDYWKQYMSSI